MSDLSTMTRAQLVDEVERLRAELVASSGIVAPQVAPGPLAAARMDFRALAAVLGHAPVGVAVVDQSLHYQFINAALASVSGQPPEAHLGRAIHDMLHVELADTLVPLICAVLEGGAPIVDRQIDQACTSGRQEWHLSVSVFPVVAGGGPALGAGVVVCDVTERLATALVLRESEARYRSLVETAADVIIGVLPNDTVFEWNHEAEAVFGRSRAEMCGRSCVTGCFLPETQPAVAGDLRLVFAGQALRDREHPIVTCPHGRRAMMWNMTPLQNSAGRPVAAILVGRDITERKHLEAELAQSQKMESIGRLAGGVAHDFNNLLTAISGYAFLALDSVPASSPARGDLEEIQTAAERAARLTRQLLAFARKQAITPRSIDLVAMLREMEHLLRRLLGDNIILQTQIWASSATIYADPSQVEQVILNLAVNARDAMPDGGTLTLEIDDGLWPAAEEPAEQPGAEVRFARLSISDTGGGMPAETLERLFEPFFTTKAMGRGTGLGLSTCYGIVRQHGGSITCQSAEGQGTTFVIDWPLAVGAPQDRAVDVPAEPLPCGHERILLVEDEPAVRALAARVLRERGYAVTEAGDGLDALALVEGSDAPADLLLSDAMMPRLGGYELARRLRARWPGIPVLIMSGHTGERHGNAGPASDQFPFLHKPFTPALLAVRVRDVLSGRLPLGASGQADNLSRLGELSRAARP